MKDSKIRTIALAGVLAAAVILLTTLVSIPMPGGYGYINLGDAGVLLAATMLGGVWGAVCAGVGSAISDLILGWGIYAPATLVIKGGMALLCWFLLKKFPKKLSIVAYLIAVLCVPVGYFLFETALYGAAVALPNVVFNLLQCAVGAVVAQAVALILQKANVIKTLTGKSENI